MNDSERKLLARKIHDCAILFGKLDLNPGAITMYINLFETHFNNSCDELLRAYDSYMNDSKNKFFPAPIALREYLFKELSQEDNAKLISAKIIESVKKFGWNNSDKVRQYVGPIGWKAIESWGGWLYICENLGSEINIATFNAQTRDLIKANLNYDKVINYNENQIETKNETLKLDFVKEVPK
jgi:hypothetical protein